MGTNFYWNVMAPWAEVTLPTGVVKRVGGFDTDDPDVHIGKRSGAGAYCFDCKVTLCKDGESRIHYSDSGFYDECPKCDAPNTVRSGRPDGNPVSYACSFSWAQDPNRVRRVCGERLNEVLIHDSYGKELTGEEFLEILKKDCPIEFTDSIGRPFS